MLIRRAEMPKERAESPVPLEAERVAALRAALVAWFVKEGRDYPWRRTRDPYAVLVSEVMLQQTQIATVLGRGYYERWMEQFPDVAALAAAPEGVLLKAWEGLGYYARARNLQKAAAAVVSEHGGRFPETAEGIAALPGVGRYTAGAVLSFAYGRPAAIVDGNIVRVFSRLFGWDGESDGPEGMRTMWAWAEELKDREHPREGNSALMELGQRVCTPRRPDCEACPVREFCVSAGPEAELRPRRRARREVVAVTEHALFAVRDGRILLARESGTRRRGLWRLPLRSEDAVTDPPLALLSRTNCAVTHYRIRYCVYDAPGAEAEAGEEWVAVSEAAELAMPGPVRRVVDGLLAAGGS